MSLYDEQVERVKDMLFPVENVLISQIGLPIESIGKEFVFPYQSQLLVSNSWDESNKTLLFVLCS
jgi:hypothetical protein